MNIQRPTFVVKEAQDKLEAVGLILSGLWFFLEQYTKTTLAVLLLMSGSSVTLLAIGYLYMKSDSITVQRATPITKADISFEGSMMPLAIADGRKWGDSILVNGKLYGFSDPRYQVWKLMDQPAIMIHDKRHNEVLKAEAPVFSEQSIEKHK